jgi:ATP-binding cassette subfamily B protein
VVLEKIDLVVEQGERLALVGPTGAGKSTLGKLVARFYDPTAGRVTYGGVDLRDASLGSLRARIVVVPQEGFLFTGSLLDNVRLGRADATDDDVAQALDEVGALERFSRLPKGLATQVSSRGVRFSAGERQLISLARVALADPSVIVLDEATSNLDPVTEREVESAVDLLAGGRTLITIAHRLSTAEHADRVVLVESGRITEVGAHRELISRGERYARLFASWLGSNVPDPLALDATILEP